MLCLLQWRQARAHQEPSRALRDYRTNWPRPVPARSMSPPGRSTPTPANGWLCADGSLRRRRHRPARGRLPLRRSRATPPSRPTVPCLAPPSTTSMRARACAARPRGACALRLRRDSCGRMAVEFERAAPASGRQPRRARRRRRMGQEEAPPWWRCCRRRRLLGCLVECRLALGMVSWTVAKPAPNKDRTRPPQPRSSR